MTRGPALIPLDGAAEPALAGGKAATLARLRAAGLPVPPGWVVPVAVLDRHLQTLGLDPETAGPATIRDRLRASPLPASLSAALAVLDAEGRLHGPLAVRSSAVAEDGHAGSFAGQLSTVLGVVGSEAVEAAIRTVWISPWSERCTAYARDRGLVAGGTAIIVQAQVAAVWSGVLFTRDPIDGAESPRMVLELAPGLGEALVSGAVTPETLHLDRVELRPTPAPDDPSLNPVLQRLGRLALDLEALLGGPQDIEWSLDDAGRLWLLQARPITAMAMAASRVIWSNANIAENFPEPVSPLLFSIVRRGYAAYFRGLADAFGISQRRSQRMAATFDEIVGVHDDRLYYNVTAVHGLIHEAPFGAWLARAFNRFTGVEDAPNIARDPTRRLVQAVEVARIALAATARYLRVEPGLRRFEARVDAFAAVTRRESLAGCDPRVLHGHLRHFLRIRQDQWTDAALADVAAMVTYALLEQTLARLPGRQAAHNDLLKGLPGLASAAPVEALWRLGRRITADPALASLFRSEPENIRARLDDAQLADFKAALDDYLERLGFRYSAELMLTRPTPAEDPLPVLRLLQRYAAETGPGPSVISARQAEDRARVTDAIARELTPHPLWRRCPLSGAGRFRLLLRLTQGAIRLRERARMKQALLYTRLRHVVLAAGQCLAAEGLLDDPADVFHLTIDDLLPLLTGGAHTPTATAGIAAARRAAMAESGDPPPPDRLVLADGARFIATSDQGEDGAEDALAGLVACGGSAEGPAVVVLDVAEAGRIKAGDILVTRQTDPGWAAVFFLVEGLVIERGGMLSHGAIIAREYGIPAVVGVEGATRRIADGARVRVDGMHGRVELAHG